MKFKIKLSRKFEYKCWITIGSLYARRIDPSRMTGDELQLRVFLGKFFHHDDLGSFHIAVL